MCSSHYINAIKALYQEGVEYKGEYAPVVAEVSLRLNGLRQKRDLTAFLKFCPLMQYSTKSMPKLVLNNCWQYCWAFKNVAKSGMIK